MAKRHGALGSKHRRSSPPKTKKRRMAKQRMLAERAARKSW